jgi:hypothetical protein
MAADEGRFLIDIPRLAVQQPPCGIAYAPFSQGTTMP